MIKRIIYIGSPSYLIAKNGQLLVKNTDSGEVSLIPKEDMGYLELDSPQITITNYCCNYLAQQRKFIRTLPVIKPQPVIYYHY